MASHVSEIHDYSSLHLKVQLKIPLALNLRPNAIIEIHRYKMPNPVVSKIKHLCLNNPV